MRTWAKCANIIGMEPTTTEPTTTPAAMDAMATALANLLPLVKASIERELATPATDKPARRRPTVADRRRAQRRAGHGSLVYPRYR